MNGLTPYLPEDFAEFWQEAVAEANSAPLDAHRSVLDTERSETHRVEEFTFRGILGETRHGWIATPRNLRHVPAFLWVPPYSRWSMQPNQYGTRPGYASLSFNFFGESAFHEETYHPSRGYFADGAGKPKTWIFRSMLQDLVLATRFLAMQVEVDENRMGAMGMSQGAGLSIWLAAWDERIKAVCADMPFLGGMPWVFQQAVHRYPLKELTDFMESIPLGRESVLFTLSYYDTINQATQCTVPTLVTLGLKDPAVRPEQARAVFDALPGEKELVELDWGHDWHPSMVDRNLAWLTRHMA